MLDSKLEMFDEARLYDALAQMSDDDLAALEDDLDFCNFTGVPTTRVLDVLKELTALDKGWEKMWRTRSDLIVPSAY